MQLRDFPVTAVPEGSDELDDESEWIYKQAFCKPTISNQVCKTILAYSAVSFFLGLLVPVCRIRHHPVSKFMKQPWKKASISILHLSYATVNN
jgi:hypothetical protein